MLLRDVLGESTGLTNAPASKRWLAIGRVLQGPEFLPAEESVSASSATRLTGNVYLGVAAAVPGSEEDSALRIDIGQRL